MRLGVVPLPPAGRNQSNPAVALAKTAIQIQRPLETDLRGIDIPLKQLHPRQAMPGTDMGRHVANRLLEIASSPYQIESQQLGERLAEPGTTVGGVNHKRGIETLVRRMIVFRRQLRCSRSKQSIEVAGSTGKSLGGPEPRS